MTNRRIGYLGEKFVGNYLQKSGYEIVEYNYTIKGGELDIIAIKDDIIAFVEVKTRDVNSLDNGFEAVTSKKKQHIAKTAQHYYLKTECELQPRFDIVVLTVKSTAILNINYVENAFDLSGMDIVF